MASGQACRRKSNLRRYLECTKKGICTTCRKVKAEKPLKNCRGCLDKINFKNRSNRLK